MLRQIRRSRSSVGSGMIIMTTMMMIATAMSTSLYFWMKLPLPKTPAGAAMGDAGIDYSFSKNPVPEGNQARRRRCFSR